MNDVNQYMLDAIKIHVWSGFYDLQDVEKMIAGGLEQGADQEMLRAKAIAEFEKKQEEEKTWPDVTDVQLLDGVFDTLGSLGILCLHNAGYTTSDGHRDARLALSEYRTGRFYGYCFYTAQDLEHAILGQGLLLTYDHIDGEGPGKLKVAQLLKDALLKAGFAVTWDGTTNQRVGIRKFDWKN